MKSSIITLLTDFGTKDHYVASMKGVILRINPKCNIIDITHQISPQDIEGGALLLAHTFSYFPKGTIHLAIVDPGVGGERKPILLKTENYFFVGPDNGLFTWVSEKEKVDCVIGLTNQKYFLPHITSTFHGRDIFAPVAAHLSLGIRPEAFGKKIHKWVKLDLKKPEQKGERLFGKILLIDHFGNLISNIDRIQFLQFIRGKPFIIKIGGESISKISKSYGESKKGKALALFGSLGFLEIAIGEGNAQKSLKVARGDPIIIERSKG